MVLSQKGSYTIEAAIWVPILLMVLFLSLKTGIRLYSEIVEMGYVKKVEEMDIQQEFYNYQVLEEVIQEATDD